MAKIPRRQRMGSTLQKRRAGVKIATYELQHRHVNMRGVGAIVLWFSASQHIRRPPRLSHDTAAVSNIARTQKQS